MPLIQCRECGTTVSTEAAVNIIAAKKFRKVAEKLIPIAVLSCILVACSDGSESKPSRSTLNPPDSSSVTHGKIIPFEIVEIFKSNLFNDNSKHVTITARAGLAEPNEWVATAMAIAEVARSAGADDVKS